MYCSDDLETLKAINSHSTAWGDFNSDGYPDLFLDSFATYTDRAHNYRGHRDGMVDFFGTQWFTTKTSLLLWNVTEAANDFITAIVPTKQFNLLRKPHLISMKIEEGINDVVIQCRNT